MKWSEEGCIVRGAYVYTSIHKPVTLRDYSSVWILFSLPFSDAFYYFSFLIL